MTTDDRDVLAQLVDELNAGRVEVVDLTQPLGPDTPVIGLPPIFAPSPGLTLDRDLALRRARAGAGTGTSCTWASTPARTSTRRCTGSPARICRTTPATRFPPRRFVGPACVDRRDGGCRGESRFSADAGARRGLGGRARPDPRRRLGAAAHRLEPRARRARRSSTPRRRPAQPGLPQGRVRAPGSRIATSWASASRPWAPTPGRPAPSIRRSPITPRCTAPANSASPACCNLDQLPPTGAVVIAAPLRSWTAAAVRCGCWLWRRSEGRCGSGRDEHEPNGLPCLDLLEVDTRHPARTHVRALREDTQWKPTPDRFSVAEVLAHLSHSEGHCYRMRVDRFLAEDRPELEPDDAQMYLDLYRDRRCGRRIRPFRRAARNQRRVSSPPGCGLGRTAGAPSARPVKLRWRRCSTNGPFMTWVTSGRSPSWCARESISRAPVDWETLIN